MDVVRESNAHLRAAFSNVLNRKFVLIGIEPIKTLERGAEADAHLQALDAIGGDARAVVGDGKDEAIRLPQASDLNATGNVRGGQAVLDGVLDERLKEEGGHECQLGAR